MPLSELGGRPASRLAGGILVEGPETLSHSMSLINFSEAKREGLDVSTYRGEVSMKMDED